MISDYGNKHEPKCCETSADMRTVPWVVMNMCPMANTSLIGASKHV